MKTAVIAGVVLLLTASGILHIVYSRHDVITAKQPVQEKLIKATGSHPNTASSFWRRVQVLRQSRADALAADDALREKLVRLQALLYAPPTEGGPRSDAAYNLMQCIPLEQRAAALDMVTQALRDPNQHTCQRAIWLLPLIWPQGEAALPTLWDLIRTKSAEWPAIAAEAMMAAAQVRSEPDIVPELIAAAMQGPAAAHQALAVQIPLLLAQLKGDAAPFTTSLQPFLYSPDEGVRLTAAQALGQLPGEKDPAVVTELMAALGKATGTGHELDTARDVLGVLWKMGPAASDAIHALLTLADQNSELRDAAQMALKAIAPDALKGVGIPTPLPPRDGTSEAIAQQLEAGTWTMQNAIAALQSPQTMLPTARALAEFGPGAVEALPALQRAFDAVVETDLPTALVLGAAMERLAPDAPKPLLMITDVLPALEAVYQAAKQAGQAAWDEALQSLPQRVPINQAFRHEDVRKLVEELNRIDPRLSAAFRTKLLENDAKFASILKP